MKRILLLLVLVGFAAFGLMACQQEEDVAGNNNGDPVVAASTENEAPAVDATVDTAEAEAADDVADVTDPAELEDGSRRGPITILGNADFTSENGVVGGTGTAEDPYIIAGWEITVPAGDYFGVRIENVTAQFVLRGLMIQNATEMNGAGIRIGFAAGGAIESCSISNSMHGINIVSSTDLSIDNCILYVTGRGLTVLGESQEHYRHQIATSNQYNNLPIYYYYGLDGDTITGLRGTHLTVAASRNVTVSNNEIVNGDGITFAYVEDSTIALNVAHRLANVITENGIRLYESHNNRVVNNLIKNNRSAGIQLTLSNSNTVLDNQFLANDTGIAVLASDDNDIRSNLIYGNVTGVMLFGGASGNTVADNVIGDENENMVYGVSLEAAFSNTIERNLVFGAESGLMLEAQASGNTAMDNTIVACGYGVNLSGTTNTFERNLLTQHSRAILFPETFQRSITQGNVFRGNVLSDNSSGHVYTNMDSQANTFTENVFLNDGLSKVLDQGTDNVWTKNGVGNFWGFGSVADADGDGIGDQPVTVVPSAVDDTAPLASINARELGLGILGTLELGTVNIETGDGETLQIPAYTADDTNETAAGFRGFPAELFAGFPGIFFNFDAERDETTGGFTMLTVPFDLDIVFFNAAGEWVGSTAMVAQATTIYKAGAPYQYALELPSGSLKELGIDSDAKLVLP